MINESILEATDTPELTLDDVLRASQKGIQPRFAYENYREKEDRNRFLQDAQDVAEEIVVDPVKKIAGAGLALTAQLTGNETLGEYSDIVQNKLARDDMMARGPDINDPTAVQTPNLMTETVAYMGPYAMEKGLAAGVKALVKANTNRKIRKDAIPYAEDKVEETMLNLNMTQQPRGTDGKFVKRQKKSSVLVDDQMTPQSLKKEFTDQRVDTLKSANILEESVEGVPTSRSYIGNVFKTEADINIKGTAGITPLYTPDEDNEGEFRTTDNPFKELAIGVGANMAFSLPFSVPLGLRQASRANKAKDTLDRTKIRVMASDKTYMNINPEIIKEFTNRTELPENILPAKGATPEALKRINEGVDKGIIRLDDGSFILNTEKMGTQRLHMDENGRYYTKKGEGNIFTDDAYYFRSGNARPLLEPDFKEEVYAESTDAETYGYNSIRTSNYDPSIVGKSTTKWSTKLPDKFTKEITAMAKDTFKKEEIITTSKNSTVEKKPSVLSEVLVNTSRSDFEIPGQYKEVSGNETFQMLSVAAKNVRNTMNRIFHTDKSDKLVYSEINDGVHNEVSRFLNSNYKKYKDIIEAVGIRNKDTGTVIPKEQFTEAFNAAYDSALAKVVASIQKNRCRWHKHVLV